MDFIANATGAIFAQGWTPELQEMLGGRQDAAGLLEAVQAEYERSWQSRRSLPITPAHHRCRENRP